MRASQCVCLSLLVVAVGAGCNRSLARPLRWTVVASDSERTVAVDDSSVAKLGDGSVLLWMRVRFAKDRALPSVKPGTPNDSVVMVRTSFSRLQVDCARQQFIYRATADYDADGRVVESTSQDSATQEWSIAPPESGQEKVVRAACQAKSNR
jgi:hypothetical protein